MVSIATTEELLKEHKRWSYQRTDRNGTRYFHDCTCNRCGGRGGWEGWPGFTCYECGGSGIGKGEMIKVYTPEHAEKLQKQREARAAKAQAEREQKAILERGNNLLKAGFSHEGDEYVIYRVVGNTYPIKDELKALGAKFKPCVGWYFATVQSGYELQRLTEKDVLVDNPFVDWKSINEVQPLWTENQRAAEESTSEWQGEVGEKIVRKLHFDRVFEGAGFYGKTSYMYLLSDEDGNKYKWSSSVYYAEGDEYTMRCTVKDHAEYKGIKQTVLTRCTKVK